MHPRLDAHSPLPIRRQLAEPLTHVFEGGGVPWGRALPCIRRCAGFAGIGPSGVARVIEDLERSGYRSLHTPGVGQPSSISGARRRGALPAERVKGKSFGGAIDRVEKDES